jgi:hypothetical protein
LTTAAREQKRFFRGESTSVNQVVNRQKRVNGFATR